MDPDVDPVAEAAKLALSDRVTHKNWKVREAAYRELTDKFNIAEEDAKLYSDFFPFLGKIVRDANAPAQLAGFDALSKYADTAPPQLVRRAAADIAKGIVEKGLAGRPTNKAKAAEAFLMFVGGDAGDVAIESVVAHGFKHRTPKVVAASLDLLTSAVNTYGIRAAPVKPITSKLGPLFNHAQEMVRSAAKALIIEVHRWAGDAVKFVVKDAKEVTIKEIEAAFAENAAKPKPTPQKLTRSMEQRVRERGGGGAESDGDDGFGVEEQEEEELDVAEEINLIEKLAKVKIVIEEGVSKDWYTALDSKKWNARKSALDEAVGIIGEARLTPGSHQEIIVRLRKVLGKDSNVNVVAAAAGLIGKMACGLKKNFPQGAAKALTVDLFGRLKEKNRVVVSSVSGALDTLHAKRCIRITEMLEEVSAAFQHKAPKARCELLEWLSRSITQGISGAELKGAPLKCFGGLFVKATDDSAPEVRDAGLGGLAALQRVVGERNVATYMEKLDKKRKEKVDTMVSRLPSPKKATAVKANPNVAKRSPVKKKKATERAPSNTVSKVEKTATPPTPLAVAKPVPDVSDDEGDINESPADALALAASRFEGFDPEQWNAKSFKARAAVASLVCDGLKEKEVFNDADVGLVLGLLCNPPGLADTNFMALKPKLELLKAVAEKCSSPPPRKTLRALVLSAMEKFGDIKCAKAIGEIMMSLAQATSARYVFEILTIAIKETKNGRSAIAMLKFASTLVENFGIPAVPMMDVSNLAASTMDHSTPAARNASVSLACKSSTWVDEGVFRKSLETLKASEEILAAFDSEVQKYTSKPEPPSLKKRFGLTVPDQKVTAIMAPETKMEAEELSDSSRRPVDEGKDEAAVLNEEVPRAVEQKPRVRVSMSQEFPSGSRLFLDLKNSNWKKRQEALGDVNKAIADSQDFIKADLSTEMITALRSRLSDSNRNIAVTAYGVLGRLIRAMGPDGVIYLKAFAPSVIGQGCVDIKKSVREAAMKVLRGWFETVGLAPLIPFCHLPMGSLNSSFRKEFLEWLLPRLQGEIGEFDSSREDLSALVDPFLSCLRDRTVEVRHLADLCLEQVIRSVGINALDAKLAMMTKAARNHIEPMLEKYRGSVQSGPTRGDVPLSNVGVSTPKPARERPRSLALPRTPLSRRAAGMSNHDATPGGTGSRRPRPASARVSPMVSSLQGVGTHTRLETEDQPVFTPNDGRDARARRYTLKKRLFLEELSRNDRFVDVRPLVCEGIEDLAQDLNECCSAVIAAKLTAPANRFRMHTEAVDDIVLYLEKKPESLVFAVDVLLRWAACRIEDSRTPPTVQEKMGRFVANMCEVLMSSGAKIGEYEAGAVLPPIIDKSGSSRGGIREAMQTAILSVGDVVDDEVLISLLTSCLRYPVTPSAHLETSSEICRILAKRCGSGAGIPSGVLPALGKIAGGEDDGAGRAAVACLEQAHEYFGDDLWSLVGDLMEDEAVVLDERLKKTSHLGQNLRSSRESNQHVSTAPATAPHSRVESHATPSRGFPSNIRNEDFRLSVAPAPPTSVMTSISDSLNTATPTKTRALAQAALFPATPSLPSRQADPFTLDTEGKESIANIVSRLQSEDRDLQLSGLASIFDDFKAEAALVRSEGGTSLLVQLVHCFTKTLARLQGGCGAEDDPAVLKSFMKGIIRFAREPELLSSLDQDGVEQLLEEALHAMVPQAVQGVDDWDQVRRGVNLLIVKMLESCNQNLLYTCMIGLLMQNIKAIQTSADNHASVAVAKSSICIKSIAKVTQRGFQNCRINALLRDIHLFLMTYPVRQDGTWLCEDQSFAMRLLKAVVNTLIEDMGEDVLSHLDLVSNPESSQLTKYINMMLGLNGRDEGQRKEAETQSEKQRREAEAALDVCLSRIADGNSSDSTGEQARSILDSFPGLDLGARLHRFPADVQRLVRDQLQQGDPKPDRSTTYEEKPLGEVSFLGMPGTLLASKESTENESIASPRQAQKGAKEGSENGSLSNIGGHGAGEVYLKRLMEIQLRYGLQTGSLESSAETASEGMVEKENGSLEKQEVRQEVRGKASSLRDRMARIRGIPSMPEE